ncbi:CDP-diacylglycerol--serine O-phosphatidyltransferase [Alicyclobacillus sacchari]|uniref:CDP-diacylglycerol--serine O-phosphatidyltransferase n=1 Tax=Alicyclobacillus sacchari TaxID=392010 RepID=A0A4R8LIT8_9BACL|nr:CDP-diacylglycerol--serine O-phosphatidyltransferase [Alicyclobacillus sacchari]TDY42775.1 CDP-diacylglycerol--serine O-phosphatidyltransferase [Alicyclobacillus sacchari]
MFIRAIPNALTLLNLVVGVAAALVALHGRLDEAALLVVLGMLLDGLDGRAARWLHAESEFGKQLDSLSDMITFGVAPVVVMYQVQLRQLGLLGDFLAVVFPICGALRLARFNTQTKARHYFVGLPITAAGGVLATMALMKPVLHPAQVILPAGMFILSLLMVSSVRYPNFKRVSYPKSVFVLVPLFAVAIFVLIRCHIVRTDWLAFGILGLYALYGVMRAVRYRLLTARRRSTPADVATRSEE